MGVICLKAIWASGNFLHKAVLWSSFQVHLIWESSVDACSEAVICFMIIYWCLIWSPKNLQNMTLCCVFKKLMNLQHWFSDLFCTLYLKFSKQSLCKVWVRTVGFTEFQFSLLYFCTFEDIIVLCIVGCIPKTQGNYFLAVRMNKWLL